LEGKRKRGSVPRAANRGSTTEELG
jgi:hypothetical protein